MKFLSQINVNTEYTLPFVDGANGQVLTTDGNGAVYWGSVSAGSTNLNALTDVVISSPSTGQLLRYGIPVGSEDPNPVWYNWSPNYLTTGSSIDALGDVTITTATAGQILQYNGTAWVNTTLSTVEYVSKVQHLVKAGVAITKGQAVYVTGADGTNMIVGLASNASEATSSKVMGLAASTAAINDQIFVVTEGLLAGLNTSTATAGDPVWLGANGNLIFGLLNKPTSPLHLVYLGVVTRVQQNNGEIFVKVQNGIEIDEIHDVQISSPATGQLLRRDTDGYWKNWTPNFLTAEADTLDSITVRGATTTNAITVGGLTVDTNTLVVDAINNRVGIGTAAPGALLQVGQGSTTTDELVRLSVSYTGTTPRGGIVWHDTANVTGKIHTEYNGSTMTSMVFGSLYNSGYNSNALMFIRGDGRVGIGTTSPLAKLDVNGAANATSFSSTALLITNADTSSSLQPDQGDPANKIYSFRWGGNEQGYIDTDAKITFAGFKTPAGTSSQFLKANGTVDSNTYVTSTALNGYATETWVNANFYNEGEIDDFFSGAEAIGGYNKSNWDAAYNDKINSASFNTTTGVLTLTQQDLGTVTVDLDGRYLESLPTATSTVLGGIKVGTNLSISNGVLSATDTDTVTSVGIDGDLSTGNIELRGGGATTITKSGGTITISSTDTDTNTTYSAGTGLTLTGTTFSVTSGTYAAASHNHDDRYYTETESDSRFVNASGDTMSGSLSFDAAAVIKKRITSDGFNPVKTASGVLAAKSDNGSGYTYYIIETNVPQDEYQMGGFTIEIFGNYYDKNSKTKVDLGGYWNPESNGGFEGFEAHGTNPQYKPTIQVSRNSIGNTAFIISGVSWQYPIIVARDLWLGYNSTDGGSYGEGWSITGTNDVSSYSNRDTVVWRNAYSDSNPAGYITGYTETDTLNSVTGRGATTANAISVGGVTVTAANVDVRTTQGRFQVYNTAGTGNLGYRIRTNENGGWRWQFVDGGNNEYFGVEYSSGNVLTGGSVTANRFIGSNSLVLNNYTTVNPSSNVFLYSQPNDRDAWIFLDSADTGSNWGIYHRQIDSAVGDIPANSIGFVGGGSSVLQAYISLANGNAYFRGTVTASGGNSTNWNAAYSWGNHALAPYWNVSDPDPKQVESQEVTFAGSVIIQGTLTESSSIRFKENITPLDPALDKVNQLEAVSYNKIGVYDREIGLIAEDVAELFPEVVTYNEEGQPQGIQYQRLSVILLKAVQELTERVNKLENK
jgi:hypothetical protein